jgi:hypothetical protein
MMSGPVAIYAGVNTGDSGEEFTLVNARDSFGKWSVDGLCKREQLTTTKRVDSVCDLSWSQCTRGRSLLQGSCSTIQALQRDIAFFTVSFTSSILSAGGG